MTIADIPKAGPTRSPRNRRRRRLLAVATAAASSVLALGAAEIILRFTDHEPQRFVYDAEAGYVNRPNAEFMFRTMKVRTGPDGRIASPVPGASANPDLLVVGDSYAAGQCASWPDGCVEVATTILSRSSPGFTTINLGTSGYGTDQCLLRLRKSLPTRPRTALYLMFDNDLHDNFDHLHFGLFKPRFEIHDGILSLSQQASPLNRLVLDTELGARVARQFVNPDMHMTEWTRHSAAERANLALALILAMERESQEAGARFIVAAHWLPTLAKPEEDYTLLLEQLRTGGVEVIVLNDRVDLAAHYDAACWHWDTEGHRLVGEELAKWIAGSADPH